MHPHAPYPAYGAPPAQQRSGAPKTLGILSIVFGALATLSSIGGFFGASIMKPPPGAGHAWDRYLQEIRPGQYINSALILVMSVILIVIGTGQLKYRRWAPKASIYWGIAAFVVLAVLFVVHLTITGPAMTRFFESQDGPMKAMGGMSNTMAFMSLLLYTPYPIVLLVTFRKPNVVASMTE